MGRPDDLKKALDKNDPRIDGFHAPIHILKELTGIKKSMVHTSAIFAEFHPTANYSSARRGLIFETQAKPIVVLPFDLGFFRQLENYVPFKLIKSSGLLKELEIFVFDSVPAMAKKWSNPKTALRHLITLLESYKDKLPLSKIQFGMLLSYIKRKESLHEHNEVIFEEKIEIKPLAVFGRKSMISNDLECSGVSSTLQVYPTAEAYFKEHKVVYK